VDLTWEDNMTIKIAALASVLAFGFATAGHATAPTPNQVGADVRVLQDDLQHDGFTVSLNCIMSNQDSAFTIYWQNHNGGQHDNTFAAVLQVQTDLANLGYFGPGGETGIWKSYDQYLINLYQAVNPPTECFAP
jgi:hypothetical protein